MLHSFHIKNYRGFKDFTIEPLERVNLITGSNNVGKTSLLEALYLNLAPGSAFYSNDSSRPESSTWVNLFRGFKGVNLDNLSKWGWLFYGRDLGKNIELTSSSKSSETQKLQMQWLIDGKGGGVPILSEMPLDNLSIYLNVHLTSTEGKEFSWMVFTGHGESLKIKYPTYILDSIPLRLLFSVSPRSPEEDTKWFSKLDDLGRQDEIVNILRLIEPRLKSLAVSTSDGPAMIYGDIGIGRRVPMSQMGEGMVRLLSLVLEITNASGGVVLIDEIENGLHHSVLTKVWRAIGEAARRSDTQIFATTHSWECIRAAHGAFLQNGTYDLRLHRLDRSDEGVRSVTYDKGTLNTSVEMNLEVR
jgi:AAA15 family ATPase/GTPase